MRKLRLLLFSACNRNCEGCCNKQWDLAALPVEKDFTGYDEIMLTGGEPMLNPGLVRKVCEEIRQQNPQVPIYLYTAYCRPELTFLLCSHLDGVTLTLHEQSDVNGGFGQLIKCVQTLKNVNAIRAMRLNVFDGVRLSPQVRKELEALDWHIKDGIVWVENCPLPKDEVFARYQRVAAAGGLFDLTWAEKYKDGEIALKGGASDE